MFCPNCGRDNSRETKFCASCGTNLEAVSQALNGTRDGFFTKTDTALDQFIARYAEHVFRDAPAKVNDRKVGNSWKILGRGVVTSFVDIILFFLIWNILPLRFLILLISTPFRLILQRSKQPGISTGELNDNRALNPAERSSNRWVPGSFPSVSEHTTRELEGYQQERKRAGLRE